MKTEKIDLVVVGGGSAGLVSSLVAAGIGADVTLVEADRPGGDCLWTGCVPSKSLLAAGAARRSASTIDRFGFEVPASELASLADLGKVLERVRSVQALIEPHDSPERLEREGVRVVKGRGRFVGPGRLDVDGRTIRFRSAIIATGSSPVLPPIPGLESAETLTTDTIWSLSSLPERLTILGGGPVGCELGQAFARLGSQVTIIEMADRLLSGDEPFAGELLADALRSEGVAVETGVMAVSADVHSLTLNDGRVIAHDRLLVATGRRPRTEGLGLETIGVETAADGTIVVDERLRTTAARVYAAGDVTGVLPLTSVATIHARAAAPNAVLGARRTADVSLVPKVTYSDPEVASVGMDADAARAAHGDDVILVEVDHADLDRSRTSGDQCGRTQLVGDKKGRLVGATIVGHAAGEIIGEAGAWIRSGAKIADLSSAGRAYPTHAECLTRAADLHVKNSYDKPYLRQAGRTAVRIRRLLPAH